MKSILLAAAALAGATLASAKTSLPSGWFAIPPSSKIQHSDFHGKPRYLTWMADSQIKHGVEPTFAYTVSAYLSGVLLAYTRTGDPKYASYITRHADLVLYPARDGSILLYNDSNSIDDIRFGHTFLDAHSLAAAAAASSNTSNSNSSSSSSSSISSNSSSIYLTAARTLRAQIDRTRRTPAGGFYHRYPTYPDQMWLDGIYMLDVFYARWTHALDPRNATAWADIALQFDLINAGTITAADPNGTTKRGLPVHGFDYSRRAVWADPVTGAAPHVWGRAAGWYLMALVDVLDYFPEGEADGGGGGRARLLGYLRALADAVVAARDPVYGGWWNVMDPGMEGREGNYVESSASGMFVYGLLKALRMGYVEGEEYREAALGGYGLMTETFAEERGGDGALDYLWTVQTGSLSSNGTFEYYASMPLFENDLKGVAPFLFASYEYELYIEGKEGVQQETI
ncbi:cell wall glycosyl hydrolase [Diplodia corticola]|uniref:Cell wall glycosyl hydrolase n=1 Tax=Diplodia corticola TaxID=236234 RepID=A0A1J9R2F9_9PEZI|nr:cell wall glycosyl hydrolase [Diplodia corticola]OJD35582.1 cell wall glycosyl hydrolase [Diplodia corticola]